MPVAGDLQVYVHEIYRVIRPVDTSNAKCYGKLTVNLLAKGEKCKGNEPCTSYSRTFTIHNYGYGIAYTFTHNNITLEHTAMNDKNTIAHMDAHNTQF